MCLINERGLGELPLEEWKQGWKLGMAHQPMAGKFSLMPLNVVQEPAQMADRNLEEK